MNATIRAYFFGFFVALNLALGLTARWDDIAGVGSLALAAGFFTTGLLLATGQDRE